MLVKLKSTFGWPVKPAYVVLILSLFLLVSNLFFTQHVRPYNSDDVSWQTILYHWSPFNGDKVTLGSSDNFVDKLPFFALIEHFSPNGGRRLLFIEAATLATIGFTFFYASSIYFLRKAKVKLDYVNLLPFLWLASFGYWFSELLISANWRGLEIGLSFFTFALVAMVYYKDVWPLKSVISRIMAVLVSAIMGVLIYSDPYYLYFTIAPVAIISVILFLLKKANKSQALTVYGIIALGLVFSKIAAHLTEKVGIHMAAIYPAQFITFSQLASNTITALHGVAIIFGADFSGQQVTPSLLVISAMIDAFIVGFIIYKIYQLKNLPRLNPKNKMSLSQLWIIFFGLLGPLVFIVYTLSTLADITTYRYFLMLVFASILFLAFTISYLKKGRAVIAVLLIVGILFNFANSAHGSGGPAQLAISGNVHNALNYDIIKAVESRGLTKGYANYWQGSINTYLSGEKVDFLPSLCLNGKTIKMHWLINEESFQRPATKSFYINDPDIPQPASCALGQVISQLGKPQSTIMIADKTILIYNYDISTRIN